MINKKQHAISVFFACVLALALTACLTGCGKKGNPVPEASDELFAFRNVFAVMSEEGCLSVSGSVSGARQNVDYMVLDVQPALEGCEGCPFVSQESYRVSAREFWEQAGGATFRFTRCLNSGPTAYRWRLSARNIYASLPFVVTPVYNTEPGPSQKTPPLSDR